MAKRPPGGPPTRRKHPYAEKRVLLVFTEGKVTEREYLQLWQRECRDSVTIRFSPKNGVPMTLVNHAVTARRSEPNDKRSAACDEIWCVFDRDEHPGIEQALRKAAEHGIGIAYSNPCIELWLALHHQDQTAWISRQDAQKLAQRLLLCNDKHLCDGGRERLTSNYGDAKRRAEALQNRHVGNGSEGTDNPSSSVWRLIDSIRQQAGYGRRRRSVSRPAGPSRASST